jgi:hypothetical protein
MNFAYLAEYVLNPPSEAITPTPCELDDNWKNFEKELSKFKKEFATVQRDLAMAQAELSVKREDSAHLRTVLGCLNDLELKASVENIVENYEVDSGAAALTQRCSELAGKSGEMRKVLKDTDAERYVSFTCFVCLERPIDLFLDPCGHVMCTSCWTRTTNKRECPGCRGSIRDVKKIFTLS